MSIDKLLQALVSATREALAMNGACDDAECFSYTMRKIKQVDKFCNKIKDKFEINRRKCGSCNQPLLDVNQHFN